MYSAAICSIARMHRLSCDRICESGKTFQNAVLSWENIRTCKGGCNNIQHMFSCTKGDQNPDAVNIHQRSKRGVDAHSHRAATALSSADRLQPLLQRTSPHYLSQVPMSHSVSAESNTYGPQLPPHFMPQNSNPIVRYMALQPHLVIVIDLVP